MAAKDRIWNYDEKASCHWNCDEAVGDGRTLVDIHFTCNYMRHCIRPQILLSRWGRVWGTNLAQKCLIGIPQFWNPCLQILKRIGRVQVPFQFLSCFTVYSLPVITKARTLVDWCDIYSLNTTDSSILVPKTLPDKVFCLPDPSLPGWKGLRSRQGLYEDSLMWTISIVPLVSSHQCCTQVWKVQGIAERQLPMMVAG